jgi:hypothetical protein
MAIFYRSFTEKEIVIDDEAVGVCGIDLGAPEFDQLLLWKFGEMGVVQISDCILIETALEEGSVVLRVRVEGLAMNLPKFTRLAPLLD